MLNIIESQVLYWYYCGTNCDYPTLLFPPLPLLLWLLLLLLLSLLLPLLLPLLIKQSTITKQQSALCLIFQTGFISRTPSRLFPCKVDSLTPSPNNNTKSLQQFCWQVKCSHWHYYGVVFDIQLGYFEKQGNFLW